MEEWGVERRNARRSPLNGRDRAFAYQMNTEAVSKQTNIGESSERVAEVHMGFLELVDTIIDWTELYYT